MFISYRVCSFKPEQMSQYNISQKPHSIFFGCFSKMFYYQHISHSLTCQIGLISLFLAICCSYDLWGLWRPIFYFQHLLCFLFPSLYLAYSYWNFVEQDLKLPNDTIIYKYGQKHLDNTGFISIISQVSILSATLDDTGSGSVSVALLVIKRISFR